MTKKHFIALADALSETKPLFGEEDLSLKQWRHDVENIARFCASQNPRFNRNRWLSYINGECGPNGGKVKA